MGIKTRASAPAEQERFPGESPASARMAGIGHNQAPPEEQVRIDFREQMLEKSPTYERRIEDLRNGADRAVVTDDESAGKVGDLQRQIRAMLGAISDSHKAAKEPFLLAGREADSMKRELSGPLDEARDIVTEKLNAYMRKQKEEADRKRREYEAEVAAAERRAEAARRDAEEARRAAEQAGQTPEPVYDVQPAPLPAPLPAMEESKPIRSAVTGGLVSGRKVMRSQVTDYTVAAIQVLDDPKVKEAIDAAVARRVKAGMHNIEGVRVWEDVQAVAR